MRTMRAAPDRQRTRRVPCWFLVLGVAMCGATVRAQAPPDEPAPPQPAPIEAGPFGGPPGGRFGGPPGGLFGDRPPGFFRRLDNPMSLFRPSPADARPPAPGEIDALIDLAVEKVPRLGNRLRTTKRQHPFVFERRFVREFMPILRQLKRLYAEDAKLADTYRDHWQLNFELRRLRVRLAAAPADQQGRIEAEARRMFASMIQLETRVAQHELQKRENRADDVIAARIDDVLSPDYDPIAEPPPIREAIRAVRAAQTDAAREDAGAELRARVRRAIHMEIRALRDLRDRLQARGDEEVDHRVQRLKGDRRPRWRDADSRPSSTSAPATDPTEFDEP